MSTIIVYRIKHGQNNNQVCPNQCLLTDFDRFEINNRPIVACHLSWY